MKKMVWALLIIVAGGCAEVAGNVYNNDCPQFEKRKKHKKRQVHYIEYQKAPARYQ